MKITIREPGSAITHFIAMILAMIAMIPLLSKASSPIIFTSLCIFISSMILLYASSTTYHAVNLTGQALKAFRKLDHMMIFVLIAGSYTPICLTVLEKQKGINLLIAVWSIALIGMLMKALWVTCPKWVSSIIYIAMGWLCAFVFQELWASLPRGAFLWLLIGGIIYTIGGIIYALKLPIFNARFKHFGSHEVFHLFCMGGSFAHVMFMYLYIA